MDALLQNLKAVAEDTQLRILALCGQTELSVGELTSILNKRPRVSTTSNCWLSWHSIAFAKGSGRSIGPLKKTFQTASHRRFSP